MGLQSAPECEFVPVDMRPAVIRELGARWLVGFFDHVQSHPELIVNGFKGAGIVEAMEAIEKGVAQDDGNSSTDPFADLDSD